MGLTERIERGDDQENIGNRGENKKGKEIKRGHKDTLKQYNGDGSRDQTQLPR